MKTSRVLFLLGTTGSGGAENQCRYLLGELHELGVAVELAYFRRGPHHERFEAIGIPLYELPARGRLSLDWPGRVLALRRLLARHPPDLLHAWLYEAQLIALLATVTRVTPAIVLAHRSSDVLPRYRRHIRVLRLLRWRADHVIANSKIGADFVAASVGIGLDRISVVSNGIPAERVAINLSATTIREQLGIGSTTPLVCSVGRIGHQRAKDYATLRTALEYLWAALPSVELLALGPRPAELERELGRSITRRVHAVGWQPNPADWMNAADVVVVHSRSEGYSNVAGEALMLGKPVASTDTGGHASLVARAGGRIVPVGRGDLLGEATLMLLRNPPPPGEVAHVAHEELSIHRSAEATLSVYARLLGDRGDGSAVTRAATASALD
jgi:glycosyltransferase involved in cell wall biosynthesis